MKRTFSQDCENAEATLSCSPNVARIPTDFRVEGVTQPHDQFRSTRGTGRFHEPTRSYEHCGLRDIPDPVSPYESSVRVPLPVLLVGSTEEEVLSSTHGPP